MKRLIDDPKKPYGPPPFTPGERVQCMRNGIANDWGGLQGVVKDCPPDTPYAPGRPPQRPIWTVRVTADDPENKYVLPSSRKPVHGRVLTFDRDSLERI